MSAQITETTGTDCLVVVDSFETEVMTLSWMLGKLGFEIIPALTGAEALKVLETRRPDLILLDVHLTDTDGFKVCQQIQENPQWAEIPVIFISQDRDKGLVARALESGAVDYIAKPFHKQELLSRVRTQLMLKTARDHARRLARQKGEMVGIISHHLQNHLVGIQMSAQLLQEQLPKTVDPKILLLADNIRNSTGQMRVFVRAYLANAAADNGVHIKMQSVSLTDVVLRVLQQYDDAARAKELVFNATLPGEGLMVRADASALELVLDNLVSNAIKFSPPGKQIFLAVEGGPLHAICRVKDQGAGFSDADRSRMFQRYTRLSARPTGGEPSTGLGLSIAKKLIEAMGGELHCESAPQKGAEFIVRLTPAFVHLQPPAPETPAHVRRPAALISNSNSEAR